MQITTAQVNKYIDAILPTDNVLMLHGSAGIGKSDIIRQAADQYKLELIDVRLSQCDPVDLGGFLMKDGNRAKYMPIDLFPLEDTILPAGKNGFLLFLDEINAASLAVQAASYKVINDKQAGQFPLHPRTKIMCAGNLMTDRAITNRLGTAMQSRLVHLEMMVDSDTWLKWAGKNHIDYRITAYIENRPDNLHNFDPNHNDKTFACPRSWDFLSKYSAKLATEQLEEYLPLIAGTIGEGVAREFVVATKLHIELPTAKEIQQSPDSIRVPSNPALLNAVAHMIAANVNVKNIEKFMVYIHKLPIEFATITLQNSIARNQNIIHTDSVREWMQIKGSELFL